MSDWPSPGEFDAYYATPDGQRVARLLAGIVAPVIRRGSTARLLALGHAAPVLTGLDPAKLERMAVVTPGADGVTPFPRGRPSCALVADPLTLPFEGALFDQALVVHALEFAQPPRALLRELWRVLAPGGDVVLVVANRAGLWTHFENTPFGKGHPWGRNGLMKLLADAMFEPLSWRSALVAPPVRGLRWLDRPLVKIAPRIGGVHFVHARKTDETGAARLAGSGATVPVAVTT